MLAPVWLPFTTGSVARGAMLGVQAGTHIHDMRIIGAQLIRHRLTPRTQHIRACGHQEYRQESAQTQLPTDFFHEGAGHVSACNSIQT